MRRIALVVFLLLFWAPAAYAWTWPVQGPVLVGYAFDHDHPYAAGQHRGIDIGAGSGTAVVAPASGTVAFAGSVPTSGLSVTIATGDGYSVTLTHLGSAGVKKGEGVGEGDAIGTVGPSGTPEIDAPYVYMGVRVTSDEQGYVDPLSLLPVLRSPPPSATPPTAPAPAAPVAAPAPTTTTVTSMTSVSDTATTSAPTAPTTDKAATQAGRYEPAAAPDHAGPVPAAVFAEQVVAEPVVADTGGGALVIRSSPLVHVRVPESPRRRPVLPVAPQLFAPRTTVPKAVTRAPAHATTLRSRPPIAPAVRRHRRRPPVVRAVHRHGTGFPLGLLALGVLVVAGFAAMGVRMISSSSKSSEGALPDAVAEDPGRCRVAVRERAEAPGPCRRPRRALRHLRPLSPAQGQRRPHGERDGRARDARDGLRRPRRRVAS